MKKIRNIADVAAWRLCVGCGACAYICPESNVRLVDFEDEGIRPVMRGGDCGTCDACLRVCPAVQTDFCLPEEPTDAFTKKWGVVLALWEGHAADPEIRRKGSSGGALTALGAYCVEVLGMHGVLHIAQDPTDPVRNRTRLSRTREALLAAAGSRYAPASVCDGLELVEEAPAPCAIIGKPVEIAAVQNARRMRPRLDERVGVTLSFFCAESPATRGTLDLLEQMGVNATDLRELRYRGNGWPGHFAPSVRGETAPRQTMTYEKSWSFLQAYRPWSVQLWPDGTGELADISCGDPWYEKPDGRNPGASLLVARTEQGRAIVEGAIAAGYLELRPAEPWKLDASQPGLWRKKGAVGGRIRTLRLMGLPTPSLRNIDLFACWRRLSLPEKLRSTLGTARRAITRGLHRPLRLDPARGVDVKPPLSGEAKGQREPSKEEAFPIR